MNVPCAALRSHANWGETTESSQATQRRVKFKDLKLCSTLPLSKVLSLLR